MKKTLLNFSVSLLIFLIPSFIIIFINSFLVMNGYISFSNGKLITSFFSIILFFFFSFLLGKKQKSHGLIQGFILMIIYLSISLLLFNSSSNIIIKISKSLCLLFGSVIGVNFSKN